MKTANSKMVVAALAGVLVMGAAVGGTIAWLTDKTESVINTFTIGNIDIELAETTGASYKMIPGDIIEKDPFITVVKGSEACWLFVKVDEENTIADFTTDSVTKYIEWEIADGWSPLTLNNGTVVVSGVYYREVQSLVDATGDTIIGVLKDNKVTVPAKITKTQLADADGANNPTLTFTAYAVQKENIATAEDAWNALFPSQADTQ